MTRIVTTHYRYKRPPPKKKAKPPLAVPAIVQRDAPRKRAKAAPLEGRPVIVSKPQRHDAALDITPEELQRRVDAADALFRDVVRRTAARAKKKTR